MLQLLIIVLQTGLILNNNVWGGGSDGRLIAVLVAFIIIIPVTFLKFIAVESSISRGQYETGQSTWHGTKSQIFFKIVLLQVVKRIVPPMSNEIITLVKDTSLARIIAVYELIWAGQVFIKSAGIIWPYSLQVYFILRLVVF